MKKQLLAGACTNAFVFPAEAFPTGAPEFYIAVHDPLSVTVLILEKDERFVFFSGDLVNFAGAEHILDTLSAVCRVDPDHILFHVNHCLGAPHFRPEDSPRLMDAILHAVKEAAVCAEHSMCPVQVGIAEGQTNINVSRIRMEPDGCYQGTDADGYSDHSLKVLSFRRENGSLLAMFYAVNCPPGVMEGSSFADGHREITADIAGSTARQLHFFLGDSVSLSYLAAATGDQWQILRSCQTLYDANGAVTSRDMHEAGFQLVDAVGSLLAQDVLRVYRKTVWFDCLSVTLTREVFESSAVKPIQLTGRDASLPHPGKSREENGITSTEVCVLKLDDLAIVFTSPELQSATVSSILCASPFSHTILLNWCNPLDSKGTYMMERALYEHGAYQAFKSVWAEGTAEQYAIFIIRLLRSVKGES